MCGCSSSRSSGPPLPGVDRAATGSQRVLVALAGPVPGLAFGFGLLWLDGRLGGNSWLHRAALMFIGINGSNLLPLLPLDGGQVLNETVFCRHPWLRAAFRLLAGAGLLALGSQLHAPILLGGLGILMITSVGSALRSGGVLKKLRADGIRLTEPAPAPGQGEEVRPESLPPLINAILASHPQATVAPAARVAEALGVLRLFRNRPPSWGASLGWVGLYAAVCVAAVLGFTALSALPGCFHSSRFASQHELARRRALLRSMAHPQRVARSGAVVLPTPAPGGE